MSETARSAEILFIKSVKNGVPNRDPETGDARRIFDDGRVSASDVSMKRDARDHVAAKYPEGEEGRHVYFKADRNDAGYLLGRKELAERILMHDGLDPATADVRMELPKRAWDVRAFGVVYSVGGANFNETGPVQISWGHSLHPVESRYVRNMVSVPARGSNEARRASSKSRSQRSSNGSQSTGVGDPGEAGGAASGVATSEEEVERGQKQGGVPADSIILPFAVYCASGVINNTLADKLGTTTEDVDLVLEGLWSGTRMRQSVARGLQQPLFMLHVEYEDPFFRIGYPEEYVRLVPDGAESWLSETAPSSVGEVALDVGALAKRLGEESGQIARVRYWLDPRLQLVGLGDEAPLGALGDEQPRSWG